MIDPRWYIAAALFALFIGRELWLDGYQKGVDTVVRDLAETRFGAGTTVSSNGVYCFAFGPMTGELQWPARPNGACYPTDAPQTVASR